MWDRNAIAAQARERIRAARDEWGGAALSLALHLLLALAVFWYATHRPALRQTPSFRTLPVDLVLGEETRTPGPSATEAAPQRQSARQRQESAPVPEGTRPNAVKQPEDELTAQLRALAQLRQPEADLPQADNETGAGGNGSGAGAYSLKDFVRAQISAALVARSVHSRIAQPAGAGAGEAAVERHHRRCRDPGPAALPERQAVPQHGAVGAQCGAAGLAAGPAARAYDKVKWITVDLDPKAVLR